MKEARLLIEFEPIGRRTRVKPGDTILSAAQDVGIGLVSLCGGIGACDSCKVRVAAGRVDEPTLVEQSIFPEEQIAAGWRLACQSRPLGNVKIEVPTESLTAPQRLQLEGELPSTVKGKPSVVPLDLALEPPSLHDLRSDAERLADAVETVGRERPFISRPVMALASGCLRRQAWSVRLALRDKEIVAILPQGAPLMGLAVDIGTTSIAVYLVDLLAGQIIGKLGAMNPQISYGEDVISRIRYINDHEDGQRILQERVVQAINGLTLQLLKQVGLTVDNVVDVVVVGNTAMHHIFAGLPVRQLGEAPYVAAVGQAFSFPARQVGLAATTGANVYMPPNIAGYVGADHVAMQAAVGLWETTGVALALDIGTNTEVTLTYQGRRYCCSCASGPAFEGAHIGAGMRAAPGAIERVQWVEDKVLTKTIGDQLPVGICGSGILDSIAVMIASGALNTRGALIADHPLVVRDQEDKPVFVLVSAETSTNQRPITISRKDVAEIQLAKAAIRAGIEILLGEAGIAATEIEQFVVAGAFGAYIDVNSAIRVGMFPDLPQHRFRQVGNAAGMGAVLLLLSQELRDRASAVTRVIDYIELTTYAAFQNEFVGQMTFQPNRRRLL